MGAWKKLLQIGVEEELSFSERSRIKITNRLVVINAIIVSVYMLVNYVSSQTSAVNTNPWWTVLLNVGGIAMVLPIFVLNHMRRYQLARLLVVSFLVVALTANGLSWSTPYHAEFYFFALAAFVFIVFRNQKLAIFMYVIQALAFGWVVFAIVQLHPEWNLSSLTLVLRVAFAYIFLFSILYFMRKEAETYQEEAEIKNSQLSLEKEEMEKLNFTKDKIFTIISHDLRSPIASLQSLLTLLNDDTIGKEDFKKATVGLEKQVFQLRNSLDELLTWSKAQLHGINPAPELVNLRQVVVQVVSVLKVAARGKRIIITTQLDSEWQVYCDPNMLHSILTNLVSNAIKFTPVGGAISIAATAVENDIVVQVEDTGVGISEENIKKILSPSVLFTTRGTNNEKGTGLGLAMCKEFVEKNKGKFEIRSEDGKGSRFIISLPKIIS